MPIYVYKCSDGHATEQLMHKYAPAKSVRCGTCNKKASRCLSAEHVNTDVHDNERWSEAMGINPEQIPEAVKTFPGSTYDSDGRLLIKNRKHKLFEMKRRGYVELD